MELRKYERKSDLPIFLKLLQDLSPRLKGKCDLIIPIERSKTPIKKLFNLYKGSYLKLYSHEVGMMAPTATNSLNALETSRASRLGIYASVCILLTKNPSPKEVAGCKVKGGRLVYSQNMRHRESLPVSAVTYKVTLEVIFGTIYSLISIGMPDQMYSTSLFALQLKERGVGRIGTKYYYLFPRPTPTHGSTVPWLIES